MTKSKHRIERAGRVYVRRSTSNTRTLAKLISDLLGHRVLGVLGGAFKQNDREIAPAKPSNITPQSRGFTLVGKECRDIGIDTQPQGHGDARQQREQNQSERHDFSRIRGARRRFVRWFQSLRHGEHSIRRPWRICKGPLRNPLEVRRIAPVGLRDVQSSVLEPQPLGYAPAS